MKTALFLFFVFLSTNIFAQNNLKNFGQIETELQNLHYHYGTSTEIFFTANNAISHNYSVLNLSGQVLAGSALAVAFALPFFYVSFGTSLNSSSGLAPQIFGVLALSAYFFGAATGVHWVAKSQNPKLPFWGTVGYSVIGGGFSFILAAAFASKYKTIPPVGGLMIALSPVISSIIYASFISDWPQGPQKIAFVKNSLSQKDLFEYSKLFDIELFRVRL